MTRETILGAIKRAHGRGAAEEAAARGVVAARLKNPTRGLVPARAQLPHGEQVTLFETQALEQAASVVRVSSESEVPGAIADYLKSSNLAPKLRRAPDPMLESLPWDGQPLLEVETGRAEAEDQVSLTAAFAGIAETGTLMLTSGPMAPVTLNFLPDTHIVVLKASQIVGPYEDAWDRLRARDGQGAMPRTVNFITGPSRTADIEQTIQLGAHGPRRLHIVLIEDHARMVDRRRDGG